MNARKAYQRSNNVLHVGISECELHKCLSIIAVYIYMIEQKPQEPKTIYGPNHDPKMND